MFWETCKNEDMILDCTIDWIEFFISALAFWFALVSLTKQLQCTKKVIFETIPLFLALLQGSVELFHTLYNHLNWITRLCYYIRTTNYTLVNIMFIVIYHKISRKNHYVLQNIMLILQIVDIISTTIFFTYMNIWKSLLDDEWKYTLIEEIFTALVCLLYGFILKKSIKRKNTKVKTLLQDESMIESNDPEGMLSEKIQQIDLTLITMMSTLYFTIFIQMWKLRSGSNHLTELLDNICTCIPVIMFPYIFYVIPLSKGFILRSPSLLIIPTSTLQEDIIIKNMDSSDLFIQRSQEQSFRETHEYKAINS